MTDAKVIALTEAAERAQFAEAAAQNLKAELDRCKVNLSSAVEVLRYIGNKVEGADTTLERSELADMANEVVAKVAGE